MTEPQGGNRKPKDLHGGRDDQNNNKRQDSTTSATSCLWTTKLGISAPQTRDPAGEEKGVSLDDVETRIKEDEWGNEYLLDEQAGTEATDDQRIIYFLYGCGFYSDKTKEERIKEISQFLHGDAKQRMIDFLKQESDVTCRRENMALWREAQQMVLRYGALKGAFTIFGNKNMPVVLRTQATRNCYQHATGGVVGYKMSFDKGDNGHKLLAVDVAKVMRRYFTEDNRLKKRVLENKGGTSIELLEHMIEGTGLCVGVQVWDTDFDSSFLKKKGPALVSRFSTDATLRLRNVDHKSVQCEDGKLRMHQFDRVGGKDILNFLLLDSPSNDEESIIEKMWAKNTDQLGDRILIHSSASKQASTNAREKDTENECDEGHNPGLHAMILIGCREGDGGKKWFLIQNTWTQLPIFEASADYLDYHFKEKGSFVFLGGKISKSVRVPLVHSQGLCLESTTNDDCPEDEEGYCSEDSSTASSQLEG